MPPGGPVPPMELGRCTNPTRSVRRALSKELAEKLRCTHTTILENVEDDVTPIGILQDDVVTELPVGARLVRTTIADEVNHRAVGVLRASATGQRLGQLR